VAISALLGFFPLLVYLSFLVPLSLPKESNTKKESKQRNARKPKRAEIVTSQSQAHDDKKGVLCNAKRQKMDCHA
jgi:hypothetical protein